MFFLKYKKLYLEAQKTIKYLNEKLSATEKELVEKKQAYDSLNIQATYLDCELDRFRRAASKSVLAKVEAMRKEKLGEPTENKE